MIATVLFSYDELSEKYDAVKDTAILEHILIWKKHWGDKRDEIISTINGLSMLGWMKPIQSKEFYLNDEDLY